MEITKLWNKIYRKFSRVAWNILTKLYVFCLRMRRRLPPPQAAAPNPENKVIYLTFDDGPGPYTGRLLNILDRYNVKATFFAVGTSRYISVLKKIAAEGHTVGNHTANHVCKELYESEESFFDALYKGERIIEEQTGIRTKLLRFPGGSESIRHHAKKPDLDRILTRTVQEKGYQYADWNVCGMDAAGACTPMAVFRNVIRGVRKNEFSVVLLHDIKPYTVDAMERILIWGLQNGYTFLPMDETGPVVHYKLH